MKTNNKSLILQILCGSMLVLGAGRLNAAANSPASPAPNLVQSSAVDGAQVTPISLLHWYSICGFAYASYLAINHFTKNLEPSPNKTSFQATCQKLLKGALELGLSPAMGFYVSPIIIAAGYAFFSSFPMTSAQSRVIGYVSASASGN